MLRAKRLSRLYDLRIRCRICQVLRTSLIYYDLTNKRWREGTRRVRKIVPAFQPPKHNLCGWRSTECQVYNCGSKLYLVILRVYMYKAADI
jgi:hypothetical protein